MCVCVCCCFLLFGFCVGFVSSHVLQQTQQQADGVQPTEKLYSLLARLYARDGNLKATRKLLPHLPAVMNKRYSWIAWLSDALSSDRLMCRMSCSCAWLLIMMFLESLRFCKPNSVALRLGWYPNKFVGTCKRASSPHRLCTHMPCRLRLSLPMFLLPRWWADSFITMNH